MLTKFSETPQNYVDQFYMLFLKYQTDSEFETPDNYFLALKMSDPKYVNFPSILDPKYSFQSSESQTPNMFVCPKFQTPNMCMITPVIKVNESPPGFARRKWLDT